MKKPRFSCSLPGCLLILFAGFWAVMTLYPMFIAVISSLKNNDEIFGSMLSLPKVFRFGNYGEAIGTAHMDRAILNSLFLTSASTLLLVVISSLASYALSRSRYKWTDFVYLLFIFGILLPIHATLIPLAKMVSSIPFLRLNSYSTLILIYIAFQLPMSVFIITGFMKSISKELDEAATIDGCDPVRAFLHITLPLSKPAISTSAIIAFLFIYNELIFAVVFLNDQTKNTVSLAMLQFVGFRVVQMGPIFASIVLAVLPMLIVYLLFQKQVQSGMTAGAVKG